MNILVVDDDRECCDELGTFVASLGHSVKRAYGGIEALFEVKNADYDAVVSDVSMPVLNGIELADKIAHLNVNTRIILISGQLEIISSINAMEIGVYDFLTKPIDINILAELLRSIEDEIIRGRSKKPGNDKIFIDDIDELEADRIINIDRVQFDENICHEDRDIGTVIIYSDDMKNIFKKIRKLYGFQEIPILLEGETGTGKEVIARSIHNKSSVAGNPFVGLNCSAIPRDMFESELFGYAAGAFTGANPKGNDGKIRIAGKGTLFLDEITEIPPDLQAKLLRVLQEKEYYPLGARAPVKVEARIICATNRDIGKLVAEGVFRQDLYYRLNVCKVVIPPLRERKKCIIPLAVCFIKKYNKKFKKDIRRIDSRALKMLMERPWPGNVRELENFIINLIIDSDGTITADNIREALKSGSPPEKNGAVGAADIGSVDDIPLPEGAFSLEELNISIVKKILEKFNGNKTRTAAYLGLTRNQMYRRFKI